MGRTRAPRCPNEANGRVAASNSSSGTMGCFYIWRISDRILLHLRVPSGTSIGWRAYSQCATLSSALLSHTAGTPNKHGAISQLCTVDTREEFDG